VQGKGTVIMSGPMIRLTHNDDRQPRTLIEAQDVHASIELVELKDFQTMFNLFKDDSYFCVYDSADNHFKLPCRSYRNVKKALKEKID